MKYKKRIREICGTRYISIPKDLATFMKLSINTEILIEDSKENDMIILKIWRKEDEQPNTTTIIE